MFMIIKIKVATCENIVLKTNEKTNHGYSGIVVHLYIKL